MSHARASGNRHKTHGLAFLPNPLCLRLVGVKARFDRGITWLPAHRICASGPLWRADFDSTRHVAASLAPGRCGLPGAVCAARLERLYAFGLCHDAACSYPFIARSNVARATLLGRTNARDRLSRVKRGVNLPVKSLSLRFRFLSFRRCSLKNLGCAVAVPGFF